MCTEGEETMQTQKKMSKKQKQRIQQRNRILFFSVLLLVLLVALVCLIVRNGHKIPSPQDPQEGDQITGTPVTDSPTPEPTQEEVVDVPTVSLDNLDSNSAVLMRRDDGQVICELDADKVIYPASMTKIMTALIAIENLSNLNDTMVIKQTTYDAVYLQGASLAGFPCGEDVPIMDVLYGIMLPSGAECCVAIAEYLYGSEEAFVQKMNDKAASLGMSDTHFVTSTGLHDEQHYTTVRDLAKLLSYALENETFRMIYCSKTYTTAPTKKYPDGLTFYNTMFSRLGSKTLKAGEILGGKTGYTGEAGSCLASYAKVNDVEYILITAGSYDESKQGAVEDAVKVYNQLSET